MTIYSVEVMRFDICKQNRCDIFKASYSLGVGQYAPFLERHMGFGTSLMGFTFKYNFNPSRDAVLNFKTTISYIKSPRFFSTPYIRQRVAKCVSIVLISYLPGWRYCNGYVHPWNYIFSIKTHLITSWRVAMYVLAKGELRVSELKICVWRFGESRVVRWRVASIET